MQKGFGGWMAMMKESGSAHDARLVAAMRRHGTAHILTFNEIDFRRYPEITVLTPAAISEAPGSTSGPAPAD